MRAASATLLGLHDFAAFCKRREGATTVRDLQRFDWVRDGDMFTAFVSADAFCWSMVRSLVGAVLAVGEGRRTSSWIERAAPARTSRSSSILVAPAHGLTLVRVDYPATRNWRHATTITRDVQDRAGRLLRRLTGTCGVDHHRGSGGASTYDGSGREGACS